MLHFSRIKIAMIVATCLLAAVLTLPNFFSQATVAAWPSWAPHSRMPLGLDLRGGAHLLFEMDANELKTDWMKNLREDARKALLSQKIGYNGVGVTSNNVVVRLRSADDAEKALTELRRLNEPIGNALLGSSGNMLEIEQTGPTTIILKPTDAGLQSRISGAAGAVIETINRRINGLGTAEATVVRQGQDRILIQYPGLSDTQRLKEIVGETALLSFHEVSRDLSGEAAKAQGRVPAGYKIYCGVPEDERNSGKQLSRDELDRECKAGHLPLYLLRETPVVRGEDLVDARQGFDGRTNEPVINFRFNQKGSREFGKFTANNIGRPFAIVLDNIVLSAPVIRSEIFGSGQISGNFTVETADKLALQLRSGALPAKLTVVEERTVGPSLGGDSIRAGEISSLIGAVGVSAFMIFAYGLFGIFAMVSVLFNMLMIVAAMSLLGSTLTLPGIAGLVLTIGMAVDSNVLIYERIREELRSGKPTISAIDAGFQRAFGTILDSNLTTLIAGLVMFWLGSGPIRGFAVTLSIGIITTVFTAFTITRLQAAMWLSWQNERKVPAPL
ncbi:MAG: protein translocase subunit SecD [Hyphomicrobiaceae bacterium]